MSWFKLGKRMAEIKQRQDDKIQEMVKSIDRMKASLDDFNQRIESNCAAIQKLTPITDAKACWELQVELNRIKEILITTSPAGRQKPTAEGVKTISALRYQSQSR